LFLTVLEAEKSKVKYQKSMRYVLSSFKMVPCIHMYVNGKMISVETIPGMGGEREIKEKGEFKYDKFDTL
jgi:hypothetical protein